MFTRLTWLALLLAGVTLFTASMLIEAAVLAAFLPEVVAGFALAAALEVTKATVVVLRRTALLQGRALFSSALLRLSLIGFSALCSLMFLAERMHEPNREAVLAADIAALDQRHQSRLAALDASVTQALNAQRSRAQDSREALDATHLRRITELETQLTDEMNNVVNGVFEGPRYRAIQSRLADARAAYADERATLDQQLSEAQQQTISEANASREQARQQLESDYQRRHGEIMDTAGASDIRSEHPMVARFLEVVAAALPTPIDTTTFVLGFALGLALLMEIGIYVAFDTLALAWGSVFAAAHKADVAVETRRVRNREELRSEQVDDAHLRQRVRNKRRHAEKTMDDALDDLDSAAPSPAM